MRNTIKIIIILLLLNSVIGLTVADDYGLSTDEYFEWLFGVDILRAYAGSTAYQGYENLPMYGPFHLAAVSLFAQISVAIQGFWTMIDVRHFANYLVFQTGVVAFFLLSRKFVRESAALVGTLIFCFQPVLFGYAFINQKDSPLMAAFIISLYLGIAASDFWKVKIAQGWFSFSRGQSSSSVRIPDEFKTVWGRLSGTTKVIFLSLNAILLLLIIDLLVKGVVYSTLANQILLASRQEALPIMNRAFKAIATDEWKTPVDIYLQKFNLIFSWVRILIVWIGAAFMIFVTIRFIDKSDSPYLKRALKPIGLVMIAATFAGIAISIRISGLFIVGLIFLYFILELGLHRSLPLILIYSIVALSVAYITWPYLWEDPVTRLIETYKLMADFIPKPVLFEGTVFSSSELPRYYLPKLLLILFTEPAVILAGSGIMLIPSFLRSDKRNLMLVIMIWFLIPFLAVVVRGTPIFANIRHVLFSIPPLFILVCLTLDWIFARVQRPAAKAVFSAILLIPSLGGIITLHPYEYSYYNEFVGGISGAFGSYHVDHWCTAYREAMEYVNQEAPQGARIAVWPHVQAARPFARSDLTVYPDGEGNSYPDYSIQCKVDINANIPAISDLYGEYPIVYEVKRGEAKLAVVRKR